MNVVQRTLELRIEQSGWQSSGMGYRRLAAYSTPLLDCTRTHRPRSRRANLSHQAVDDTLTRTVYAWIAYCVMAMP